LMLMIFYKIFIVNYEFLIKYIHYTDKLTLLIFISLYK